MGLVIEGPYQNDFGRIPGNFIDINGRILDRSSNIPDSTLRLAETGRD
jgi:hypothetical protein